MSSWRELYNHPDNAAGRKKRPDPNRIFPADSISPIFFGPAETKLTTLLFRLEENVVPKWFGVSLSPNLDDFSNPNVFLLSKPNARSYGG
jgi:hypothetical protein